MEETKIIEGERKSGLFVSILFGAVGGLLGFVVWIFFGGWLNIIISYGMFDFFAKYGGMWKYYLPYVEVFTIFGIVFGLSYKSQPVVTDKRICGKVGFGKRVDIPLDSILSVGTGWFSSISVASTSGNIRFAMLKNRDEIHSVISKLLVDRQAGAL